MREHTSIQSDEINPNLGGLDSQSSELKSLRKKYKRDLAEYVFRVLQQSIFTGELRPNQRLGEMEFAEKLGVSRTPVREALRRLVRTGFANTLPGGGIIVADHTSEQVQNSFEIREALECMAIRLTCDHITDEQIHNAEELYARSTEAIRNKNIDLYVELHRAFHHELYSACGNEQLLSLVRTFTYQFFDLRSSRSYTSREWNTQIKYHGQILEAVRERKAHRAEKILARHLKYSLKAALKRL